MVPGVREGALVRSAFVPSQSSGGGGSPAPSQPATGAPQMPLAARTEDLRGRGIGRTIDVAV